MWYHHFPGQRCLLNATTFTFYCTDSIIRKAISPHSFKMVDPCSNLFFFSLHLKSRRKQQKCFFLPGQTDIAKLCLSSVILIRYPSNRCDREDVMPRLAWVEHLPTVALTRGWLEWAPERNYTIQTTNVHRTLSMCWRHIFWDLEDLVLIWVLGVKLWPQ